MEQENNQQPQTNDRIALIERYLLDPEKTILEMLNDFGGSIEEIKRALADVDLATLETLRGEDGITPVRGVDYMTDEDIDAFEAFILDRMPVLGVDVPEVEQVNTYIDAKVAKIPRIKGDKGEKGTAGTNGKNGSPDSPKDILEKLRSLPKNQGLQIKDVRGLSSKITQLDETTDDLELLRQELSQVRISIPTNNGSSATGTVTQIDTGTGLEGGPITNTGTIQLNAASIASLAKADSAVQPGDLATVATTGSYNDLTDKPSIPSQYTDEMAQDAVGTILVDSTEIDFTYNDGTPSITAVLKASSIDESKLDASVNASLDLADTALQNITGLVTQGTNITITGAGTSASPYVITAAGGGSTPTLQDVLDTGNDANNQSISLLNTGNSDLAEMNTFGFSANSAGGLQAFLGSTGLSIRQSLNDNNVVSTTLTGDRVQTLQDRSGTLAHLDQISLSTLGITATATELNYVDGVTSDIQTQLNGKQAALSGTGFVKISGTTISYDNSTYLTTASAASTYQPLDSDLTSWAGVTRASGFDTFVANPSSANLRSLVSDETGTGALVFGTSPVLTAATITTSLTPTANDGAALGSTSLAFSDLFLASAGVINFNSGNATITHSTGALTSNVDFRVASPGSNSSSVVTVGGTQTLTYKRIIQRVGAIASTSTPTPAADSLDEYNITALATGATFGAPTGTLTDGQKLIIRIKDNGTARTLAYNAIYRAIGVTLPTTTVISKTLYLGMIYNYDDTKWDVVAVAQEA